MQVEDRRLKDIHENAIYAFANHQLTVLRDEPDGIRHYKCAQPDTGIYAFWVLSHDHHTWVYGDLGECWWKRSLDWAAGAIYSIGYFAEKVPHTVKIKEHSGEALREWVETTLREYKDHHGTNKGKKELAELLEYALGQSDNGDNQQLFLAELYNSSYFRGDCERLPNSEIYTAHFFWCRECLLWLFEHLPEFKDKLRR